MPTGNPNEHLFERPGWDDLLAPILTSKIPAVGGPTWTAFGPSGGLYQYAFDKGDSAFVMVHVDHRVKAGTKFYPHVHWATSGTDTGVVAWDIECAVAKGHNQEAFGAPQTIVLSEAATGTAWQHMITEATDAQAINSMEPDSVIIMRIARNNTALDTCTDTVFGMYCDLHYNIWRNSTPQRTPDFYKRPSTISESD